MCEFLSWWFLIFFITLNVFTFAVYMIALQPKFLKIFTQEFSKMISFSDLVQCLGVHERFLK